MMALTPDQEKLKEAALAATPGPWRECGHDRGGCSCGMIWATESNELVAEAWKGDDMVPAPAVVPNVNAAYVAAANPAAILAILAQLEQVHGWQPIETAPRDGTEIWAFNGEQARMLWSEGSSGSERWALWVWADELLQDADPSPDQPTYFKPLPPPPEAA